MAVKQLELIKPGDARFPALAKVAARHNMTPDAWQERAHFLDLSGDARRGVDMMMRQVPRYREGDAA